MSSRQSSNKISLNVQLAVPQATSGQDGSHTPNTPEILNSILNIQNGPFAEYHTSAAVSSPMSIAQNLQSEKFEAAGGSSTALPSVVQQYTSQFIKEGLRVKLARQLGTHKTYEQEQTFLGEEPVRLFQQHSPPEILSPIDIPSPGSSRGHLEIKQEGLTKEDLIRRQRRRERNKVAATKCRNKKKLRTQLLVKESESLVSQNENLKSEVIKLEREKKRLVQVLSSHQASCPKRMRMSAAEFEIHQESAGLSSSQEQPPLPAIKVENLSSPTEEEYFFGPQHDNFYQNDFGTFSPSPYHFLGLKAHLGPHFQDLDSRCIAL